MPDLFLSYCSSDRVWAKRLYDDLRNRHPTIDIFFDRELIPPGPAASAYFDGAAADAAHFVVFWSKAARHEVESDIAKFIDARKHSPEPPRILFYIPLDDELDSAEARQSFLDIRDNGVYDANAPDRGISQLDSDPAKTVWNRIVRTIGDTVMASRPAVTKSATADPTPPAADARRAKLAVDRLRAQAILRGASASIDEMKAIAGNLKDARYPSLARRLYGRALHHKDAARLDSRQKLKLVQQHALCTYKDPELPAGDRYARAIEILESGDLLHDPPSQETLGLAGAAYKYRWRMEGQRRDLEKSLAYYERGAQQPLEGDQAYTRINAAFVLDLLALQDEQANPDSPEAHNRREQARKLREEIATELPRLAERSGFDWLNGMWWYAATIAEACFGLQKFEAARFWLRQGLALETPDWEKESTARQLADLAFAKTIDLSDGSEAWRTLRLLVGDAVPALRALSIGKVGLALSGGGFRASLFHIGVLARLAEVDALRHVEVLSCVSGGSIVGAHYYLELRHLLQTKPDREITRQDYIAIVRRLQRDFLQGVQTNIRTRLFCNPWVNFLTLVRPGYTRTKRMGELLEERLYSQVPDHPGGPRYLSDMRINPRESPADFNPKLDNWRRSAKVPILVMNATTLNTGHNWQFAVTWMGEPPPASTTAATAVDRNDVLRRMYYDDEAPPQYRKIRLGHAVAASACVPALFDPIEMPGLYPNYTVRLVDGGVHDNQGVASLLEQECRVALVSDASGQMNSERRPSSEIVGVPGRANEILMARVRESEFRELEALLKSSALSGLMFLHLRKDLNVNHVDWTGCLDPYEAGDEIRPEERRRTLTTYGVPRAIQDLLAGIRTDLDSFSDKEAYALMLSGYRMADHEFQSLDQFPPAADDREPWDFLAIEPALTKAQGAETAHENLVAALCAAKSRAFKIWRLSPALRFGALPVLIVLSVAALVYSGYWWIPAWALGLAGAAWALQHLLGRKSVTVIATGLLMVTLGWFFSALHLFLFDLLFLRRGRVPRPDR